MPPLSLSLPLSFVFVLAQEAISFSHHPCAIGTFSKETRNFAILLRTFLTTLKFMAQQSNRAYGLTKQNQKTEMFGQLEALVFIVQYPISASAK